MARRVSEIVRDVHEEGQRLRVRKGKLKLSGDISPELRAELVGRREEIARYLYFDTEEVIQLIRDAYYYISKAYTGQFENLLGKPDILTEHVKGLTNTSDEKLQEAMDEAIEREDMWAFRVARKEWVESWLVAIKVAKEREEEGAA